MLFTAAIVFAIGLAVVITKKNLILMLIGVELMFNAVNINLLVFGNQFPNKADAQWMAVFVMLVAAAEVAIGLAIILKIREHFKSLDPEDIAELKD
jgi:NADH:ubiquinone oxidoreductase subunit K